jgi:ferredoxin--NADP+ reductase
MASANYEDELEFFSIKVPDGPLTSKLQSIEVGDELLVNSKATGTLVQDSLLPGKNLYLIATGTGLAPFLSIIRDPQVYERYDKVILTHGCRYTEELAYRELITEHLPQHEYLGEEVRNKLIYYPTVTREKFDNNGRLTDLLRIGKLSTDIGLGPLDVETDRFMICGSPSMLKEICALLDSRGFQEARHGRAAHYVIERAFVES